MEIIKAGNNRLQLKYVCDTDARILTAAGYEHRAELDRTDSGGELIETWCNLRFLECVFDIAYAVGYNAAGNNYISDDSREAFQLVLSWAKEFQNIFTPEMDERGEYLEMIDAFALAKIINQQ